MPCEQLQVDVEILESSKFTLQSTLKVSKQMFRENSKDVKINVENRLKIYFWK